MQLHIADFIQPLELKGQTLVLALSGGLDSRVLLHLLASQQKNIGFKLRAVHVHHGLSPNAEKWAEFCRTICNEIDIPIDVIYVKVPLDSGLGIEAAARNSRYKALIENSGQDQIVLAHHQDDQAETLLLQLLRGAGAKGLAAMAAIDQKRRLLRPLLDVLRHQLEAYATAHDLAWIEDESNEDEHYDRNFCRHQILPVLTQRFPAVSQNLARSASHLAEASALLDELASLDARTIAHHQIDVAALSQLSDARARNLLRWWLAQQEQPLPNTNRLQEMLHQLLSAKSDAALKVAVDAQNDIWLRRYQGMAYIQKNAEALPIAMIWQGEAELVLPDGSRLLFERKSGAGLAAERLGINKLRVSHRVGGERFKPDWARPTRTLKHLLQEAHIPPWQREHLPLIYWDETLAIVPGIGVACELQAREDEPGLVVSLHS
ncbi:tRNA lysidine(34) synthetase TilS [Methyloradius palustris]|uniref:tRNA(Ile)-lysidine synthase n=1 Tax=Methyloradius palustris TaxID=2778876 RepID=A0A8D5G3G0_9PROT|nr:tRNA lysidine(34) synthetase TilS [Methyloradius palustris]BCM25313.1 tRNA(Ile)-lysidine synthase [Methyloradius palustris]